MTTEPSNEKTFFGLTAEAFAAQAKEAGEEAIARMHAAGVATVFMKDGVIDRHHPDGRLEPVESVHTPTTKQG